jgi:hypothetical protein
LSISFIVFPPNFIEILSTRFLPIFATKVALAAFAAELALLEVVSLNVNFILFGTRT